MSIVVSRGTYKAVASKSFPAIPGPTLINGPSGGVVPLLRGDGLAASYEAIYRTQPTVFAVVNKLVYGAARNRLMVHEIHEDGSESRIPNTTLGALLRNPYPRGSEFGLKAFVWLSALVHGHSLLLKYRPASGAAPTELWPVPWRCVQTLEDDRGVSLYALNLGGSVTPIGPEDVVHVSLPGGSPLESLRRTVALEDAAATWQGENLRNGITPRGAFTSEQRIPDPVLPRLREELKKLYAGPENAGRFAILEGGLKWAQIGLSAADSQLMDQRRFSREEVCAAYDVAPPLIGIVEGAPYGSVAEYRRALYDAIAAKLVLVEDTFNAQLVSPEADWESLSVRSDTTELLRPDPEARARMHMLTQQASTTTINERRNIEGLPRIEDPMADTVFMPVNMLPVGQSSPVAAGDPAGTPAQGLADRVVTAALVGDERETM